MATGRGGIPKNPNDQVDINSTWSDLRYLSVSRHRNNDVAEITKISNKPAIIEATNFARNASGEIELVASGNMPFSTQQVADCSVANT